MENKIKTSTKINLHSSFPERELFIVFFFLFGFWSFLLFHDLMFTLIVPRNVFRKLYMHMYLYPGIDM